MQANGSFLVDMNVVIALFNGEIGVEEKFNGADEINFSVIIKGELIYGTKHSRHSEENIQQVQDFRSECKLLLIDEETAYLYAEIKLQLRRQGHPIPENDVWIAATALQHGLTLVTRDSHFDVVEGLLLEVW